MSCYLDKAMSWSRGGTEVFKNVATPVCCPFCCLRIKVSLAKEKSISSYIGILYPTPKISNPNLNFKLCWSEILLLAHRYYFLLVPTWILLEIWYPHKFFWRIPLCFPRLGLLGFYFLGELHQSRKGQDYLRSPQPSCWLRIYRRINTRTPCWMKHAT